MYNLNETFNKCKVLLDNLNIYYGNITNVSVNTRAKKRWGQCKRVGGTFEISINSCLLDETNPIEALENTILHELLHTVYGCFNHGEMWQLMANKVNKAYGYNIKRCSTANEKGVSDEYVQNAYHYFITCNKCKAQWKYMKMCKTVTIVKRGSGVCPCGGRNFTIMYKDSKTGYTTITTTAR